MNHWICDDKSPVLPLRDLHKKCYGRPRKPKSEHTLVSQKGSNYFLRIDPNISPLKSFAVTSALGVNLEVFYSSATAFWPSPIRSFVTFINICSHGGVEMAVRMCPFTGRMEWLACCQLGCLQCIWDVFGFCAVPRIGSRLEPHKEIVPSFCG